jgi:SHS2 domain-containing protein
MGVVGGGGVPFAFADHTSEVRVRLTAATLPALFAEAARAVRALLVDRVPDTPPAAPQEVELEAPDPGALLVAWVDELVFRSETDHLVFDEVDVRSVDGRTLRATVRGRPVEALRTPVKAATFHDLQVERTPTGWRGQIVLDV